MVRDEAQKLGLTEADVPLLASSRQDSSSAAATSAPPSGARPPFSSRQQPTSGEDRCYIPWRSSADTGARTPALAALQSFTLPEP